MTARLLVVDDVPANARMLEAWLTADYYEVRTVHDGFSVQRIAETWQPDVILLDVMMPDINGYGVCKLLKARPATAHIPVVMVTALGDAQDRHQGLRDGADEFLTKPIEHEILLARLRGIIRHKQLVDEWRTRGSTAAKLGLRVADRAQASADGAMVLIIDDLPSRASRIRDVLNQASILTTLVADEEAALQMVEADSFDLFMVSLALMNEDPLRLVARLRAMAVTRDTPVLLLAETAQREMLISAFNLGANDCIMLPLDDCELVLRSRSHIERKIYHERLRNDVGDALKLAVIDPLTHLFNRRYLLSQLDRMNDELVDRKIAVLMIDVDHFKQINDRYGHPIGDKVLRGVAELLRSSLRKSDLIARYGGEEFVVVLGPLLMDSRAIDVAEKLRAAVCDMRTEKDIAVTVSIGVAVRRPGVSTLELIENADRALYDAKRQGRNKVMLCPPKVEYARAVHGDFQK